mmetsp:Transcript_106284/g.243335  ORF Transcript_106284/g.243335 Transcript_106284/m.243335 type:complete len:186 (+) Transcript_106284:42-599(+)
MMRCARIVHVVIVGEGCFPWHRFFRRVEEHAGGLDTVFGEDQQYIDLQADAGDCLGLFLLEAALASRCQRQVLGIVHHGSDELIRIVGGSVPLGHQMYQVPASRLGTRDHVGGCYFRFPAGCPAQPGFEPVSWFRDRIGEECQASGSSRDICETRRLAEFQQWCGVSNVEARFIDSHEVHLRPIQ